jgi:hypothetical protein
MAAGGQRLLRLWSLDKADMSLKIGTRSLLFGAHQFLIHPWFVAEAWRRLFGFPWDPRLWVLFFVHDFGYFGQPNMDGPEGEQHPYLGARIVHALFDGWEPDPKPPRSRPRRFTNGGPARCWECGQNERKCRKSKCGLRRSMRWHDLALYHSRFLSKQAGKPVSKFCYADKLAIALTPAWLYLPLVRASGEIHEYMKRSEQKEGQKYATMVIYSSDQRQWYENMRAYIRRWVEEHKDGRADSWTPKQDAGSREPHDSSGVWR